MGGEEAVEARVQWVKESQLHMCMNMYTHTMNTCTYSVDVYMYISMHIHISHVCV